MFIFTSVGGSSITSSGTAKPIPPGCSGENAGGAVVWLETLLSCSASNTKGRAGGYSLSSMVSASINCGECGTGSRYGANMGPDSKCTHVSFGRGDGVTRSIQWIARFVFLWSVIDSVDLSLSDEG